MVYDPFANDPMQHEVAAGGRRWTLPAGFYPMKLVVAGVGITPAKAPPEGARPFVELGASVLDGYPFANESISRRLFVSPGQGTNFHFLRAACHAITGKAPDAEAFAQYGVTIPQQGDAAARTAAITQWFEAANPETRLDMMLMYLRVKEWNGRVCTVRLGIEPGKTPKADGSLPQYNRYIGFWSINDPEKGKAWLQAEEALRLRALEASGA